MCVFVLPAGLCSQDLVNGVHADSHNVDNGLSGFSVGQAVDAQGLEGGGAASKSEREEGRERKKTSAGV